MSRVATRSDMTAGEYLAWEREQSTKHEFFQHYRRAPDGSWTYRAAGPGETATLSIGVTLIVDQIFSGVLDLPGD